MTNYVINATRDITNPIHPKVLPYSDESITSAITSGYTHFGLYIMGPDNMITSEGILLSFYPFHGFERAYSDAVSLLESFRKYYNLNLQELHYWVNSTEGFQILIPNPVFTKNPWHKDLPHVHNYMMLWYQEEFYAADIGVYMTDSGYPLLPSFARYMYSLDAVTRGENILGNENLYKVPVTFDEFFTLPPAQLLELAKEPRFIPKNTCFSLNTELSNLYEFACDDYRKDPTYRW